MTKSSPHRIILTNFSTPRSHRTALFSIGNTFSLLSTYRKRDRDLSSETSYKITDGETPRHPSQALFVYLTNPGLHKRFVMWIKGEQ